MSIEKASLKMAFIHQEDSWFKTTTRHSALFKSTNAHFHISLKSWHNHRLQISIGFMQTCGGNSVLVDILNIKLFLYCILLYCREFWPQLSSLGSFGVFLSEWLTCCLLAGPDLWKRVPLKCSITMDFTCPLLFFHNWLISMLRVSASRLVEVNAVEVFHHYRFNLPSSFLK